MFNPFKTIGWCGSKNNKNPMIRLGGPELAKNGFNSGQIVYVYLQSKMIVIVPSEEMNRLDTTKLIKKTELFHKDKEL